MGGDPWLPEAPVDTGLRSDVTSLGILQHQDAGKLVGKIIDRVIRSILSISHRIEMRLVFVATIVRPDNRWAIGPAVHFP